MLKSRAMSQKSQKKIRSYLIAQSGLRTAEVIGEISFSLVVLVVPFIIVFLLDVILQYSAIGLYAPLLLFSAAIISIIIALGMGLDFLEVHLEEQSKKKMSLRIFQTILNSAYPMGVHFNFAQITEALENHVAVLAPLTSKIIRSCGHLLQLTLICLMLFYVDRSLSLIVFLGIPLYLLEIFWTPHLSSLFFKKSTSEKKSESLNPLIKKISLIRALGSQGDTLKDIEDHLLRKMTYTVKARLISNIEALSSSLLLKLWVTLVLAFLGYSLIRGELSLGASAFFFINFIFIQSPLNHLRFFASQIKTYQKSYSEIQNIFHLQSIESSNETIDLNERASGIKLESVTLLPKEMGFLNTSLQIEAGTLNVIINSKNDRNWAWANLLLKLQNIESGTVYIDQAKIKDIKLHSLQSHIGILFDDLEILPKTLQELFHQPLKQGLVDPLLDKLGLRTWYQHYLYRQSSGQKEMQLDRLTRFKLNLIRISFQNPKILIIKNDFEWIPEEDKINIKNFIEELCFERTVLFLTEDLKAIQRAHKIFLFDGNKLVEEGNFQDLIQSHGPFYQFFHQKFGDLRDFMERLHLEMKRSERYNKKFCLSTLKIEGFDFIESSYPEDSFHIFEQVQGLIKNELRASDFCTFLDLHTFALCTPETDYSHSQIALNRILRSIEKTPILLGEKSIHLSFSYSSLEYTQDKNKNAQDFLIATLDRLNPKQLKQENQI